jgi:hypothetical protein
MNASGRAWLAMGLLTACGGGRERLPESAGGPEEVLVVMAKGHWESEPGSTVRAQLEQPMPGMPQREALFRVAQCRPQDFASLLQAHHSVLYASIGTDTTGMRMLRDVHARGQLLIRVAAKTPLEWIALFNAEAPAMADAFLAHQRERIGRRLRQERDEGLCSSMQAAHGFQMDIPGGYRVREQARGFTWMQRDRVVSGGGLEHDVIEGLLVHTHPYTSDSTWNVAHLVAQRDSVTRAYVEGPDPGSYMIAQRAFEQLDLMPTGRAVRLGDRFAYLMHGLYGMHGAKMGGPFVSLSTTDPSGRQVVTVEGFVYAPQFDKRSYLRELEAMLFSLRFDAARKP